ncbi:MAG: sialidase family protein [Planctomycetota bacterium]|nr:sialidase family protein [Planctomycetota bacterium]
MTRPEQRTALLAVVLMMPFGLAAHSQGQTDPIPPFSAPGATQPRVAIGPGGEIHLVFIREGNVEVVTSSDGGRTFGEPVIAIDANGKARGGSQRGPRVGIDASGTVYVSTPICFDEEELKKRYPTPELFLVASKDGGKTFSAPVQINEVSRKAPEGLHWMAVAPSGEVHLAWLDNRPGVKGTALYFATVKESGSKVGKNRLIREELCECCAPGLGRSESGTLFLSYREGGEKPSREIFVIGSKNGGKSFGRPVQVNMAASRLDGCPMDAPAVAVSRNGKKVAVAWMDARTDGRNKDVYWTIARKGLFDKGAPLSDSTEGYQGHPSLAFDGDGVLHAVWEDGRDKPSRIYLRSSSSPDRIVLVSDLPEGAAGFPSVACGEGWVAVAYEVRLGRAVSAVCRILPVKGDR